MNLSDLVKSKKYKTFMARLYGIGASVVIIGALFKITHIRGADLMLFVGLITESIIFFFSAFEPPYIDPDWSLVHPELAGLYHSDDEIQKMKEQGIIKEKKEEEPSLTGELDKMLKEANIQTDVIASLGQGLHNLNTTLKELNNISEVAVKSTNLVNTIESVNQNAEVLSHSYKQTADVLNQESKLTQEHVANLEGMTQNSSLASKAYGEITHKISEENSIRTELNQNIQNASLSASYLVEKYNETAQILTNAANAIDIGDNGSAFKEKLSEINSKLTSLNAAYELQMKAVQENANVTSTSIQTINELINKLLSSTEVTGQFTQNLSALSKALESQISGSHLQTQKSEEVSNAYNELLTKISIAITNTESYQKEAKNLAEKMADLTRIYGNMLSAMTVKA